jgi:hypothetical protein
MLSSILLLLLTDPALCSVSPPYEWVQTLRSVNDGQSAVFLREIHNKGKSLIQIIHEKKVAKFKVESSKVQPFLCVSPTSVSSAAAAASTATSATSATSSSSS